MFTVGKGDRPSHANVLVLVTDGNSANAQTAADAAKAAGIEIIAIGVGNQIDTAHLRNLCSNPATDLFTADNFCEVKQHLQNRFNCTGPGFTFSGEQTTSVVTTVEVCSQPIGSPDAVKDLQPCETRNNNLNPGQERNNRDATVDAIDGLNPTP